MGKIADKVILAVRAYEKAQKIAPGIKAVRQQIEETHAAKLLIDKYKSTK